MKKIWATDNILVVRAMSIARGVSIYSRNGVD